MTVGPFQSYDDVISFLLGRIDYERAAAEKLTVRDFKLDRMREFLALLGDPQETIPAVHIAGTKGKGSTAVMTSEILAAAGYRVGLFTSPHISAFEERFKVNGCSPSRDVCVELFNRLSDPLNELDTRGLTMRPTYFEIATALAWLFFRRERCDVVVLEVGMGGRLDSTNLCRPEVTVITNVSRDHTSVLGDTDAKIAAEKSGIIKSHVPVVSGVGSAEAANVVVDVSKKNSCDLYRLNHDIQATYYRGIASDDSDSATVNVKTPFGLHEKLPLTLAGAHQANNAALAITAVDILRRRGFAISPLAIQQGMRNVKWPLRLEVLERNPTFVADAAHNEASAAAVATALLDEFPAEKRVLIFAASCDKEVEKIAEKLFPTFQTIVLTQFIGNPRSISPDDLEYRVAEFATGNVLSAANPTVAVAIARQQAGPNDLICATGSFYLAAEVRGVLKPGGVSSRHC